MAQLGEVYTEIDTGLSSGFIFQFVDGTRDLANLKEHHASVTQTREGATEELHQDQDHISGYVFDSCGIFKVWGAGAA